MYTNKIYQRELTKARKNYLNYESLLYEQYQKRLEKYQNLIGYLLMGSKNIITKKLLIMTQQQLQLRFTAGKVYTPLTSETLGYDLQAFAPEIILFCKTMNSEKNNFDHLAYKLKEEQNIFETFFSLLISEYISPNCIHTISCYAYKESGPTYLAIKDRRLTVGITSKDKTQESQKYTYFEHIEGKNWYNLLAQYNTLKKFLPLWYQLLYTLYYLQKNYKFTHYDLHLANIILQDVGREVTLSYEYEGNTINLVTDTIIRLVDYATCYLEINGQSYVYADPAFYTYGRKKSFNAYYDIYLVLCSLLSNSKLDYEIFNMLSDCMTFFNDEDNIIDILTIQKVGGYGFLLDIDHTSLASFINFCSTRYPIISNNNNLVYYNAYHENLLNYLNNYDIEMSKDYYITRFFQLQLPKQYYRYDYDLCSNFQYIYLTTKYNLVEKELLNNTYETFLQTLAKLYQIEYDKYILLKERNKNMQLDKDANSYYEVIYIKYKSEEREQLLKLQINKKLIDYYQNYIRENMK
jgi:hypothetical protein